MLEQRYLERCLSRLVVLCGAATLLAGCFDVQLGLKLHNDGSGAVTTRIILSKEMTDMAAAGRSKPMPALLGKDKRNVRTTSEIRNGQLVTEETVGFARLSEMQEEILWLCDAAHVPVIWATQVLDNYVGEGVMTRAETTSFRSCRRCRWGRERRNRPSQG